MANEPTPKPDQAPPPGYEWVWDHGWVTRPIGSEKDYQPTPGANLYTNTTPYYPDGSPNEYQSYLDQRKQRMNRDLWLKVILPAAGFVGGSALLGTVGSGASTGATAAGGASAGGGAAAGGGAGAGAGTGMLATTGWTAPMAPYAAPVASAMGGGATGGSLLGSLLTNPQTYSTLGNLFTGAAQGQTGERDQRNDFTGRTNQAIAGMYGTQQNALLNLLGADIAQRQHQLSAPNQRGRTALLGSLMQNMQPVQISGLSPRLQGRVPTFSGGLNPSAISPQARQMGGLMQQGAIEGQQRGDNFAPLKDSLIPPPQMAGYQNAGRGESILSGVGIGASLLGQLLKARQGGG